jgi:hypothetical protein
LGTYPVTGTIPVSVDNGYFTTSLDFGDGVFDGNERWLEIEVNGSLLSPLQSITPAPYAIYSQTAPWSGLSGVPPGFADGTDDGMTSVTWFDILNRPSGLDDGDQDSLADLGPCDNGQTPEWSDQYSKWVCGDDANTTYSAGNQIQLIGTTFNVLDGSGSGLDADYLDGQDSAFYRNASNINAGTLSTGRYSAYIDLSSEGYLDNNANADLLTRDQADGRYWSLSGNAGTSPGTNYLGTSDNQALELGVNNARAFRIEPRPESPNMIGGYSNNFASTGVYGAFIGGGGDSSNPNFVSDHFGTVGGGVHNQAGDNAGTVDDTSYATVGGGLGNRAHGAVATISGGSSNYATGVGAFIGGGYANSVYGHDATVCGGNNNIAGDSFASVGGGKINYAYGLYSTVAGGENNYVYSGATHGTIGGGYSNYEYGLAQTISGGYDNETSGDYATIGGGETNSADGTDATVGGGKENTASGTQSTVAGGADNTAGYRSTVSGGLSNAADSYGAVPGGYLNYATGHSFAAGRRAKANHPGSFVFADSNDFDFATLVDNSFKVRTIGGVRFVVGIDGSGNTTWSCVLTYGNNWSCTSDRNMKENFKNVEGREILERLSEIPIQRWNAIGGDPDVDHISPMAQDFYAAFGLGEDERLIGTMDANGVALAAIQGLYTISQEQAEQIEDLQAENASLRKKQGIGFPEGLPQHISILVYGLAGVVVLLIGGFIWIFVRFRRLLPSEALHAP